MIERWHRQLDDMLTEFTEKLTENRSSVYMYTAAVASLGFILHGAATDGGIIFFPKRTDDLFFTHFKR